MSTCENATHLLYHGTNTCCLRSNKLAVLSYCVGVLVCVCVHLCDAGTCLNASDPTQQLPGSGGVGEGGAGVGWMYEGWSRGGHCNIDMVWFGMRPNKRKHDMGYK